MRKFKGKIGKYNRHPLTQQQKTRLYFIRQKEQRKMNRAYIEYIFNTYGENAEYTLVDKLKLKKGGKQAAEVEAKYAHIEDMSGVCPNG